MKKINKIIILLSFGIGIFQTAYFTKEKKTSALPGEIVNKIQTQHINLDFPIKNINKFIEEINKYRLVNKNFDSEYKNLIVPKAYIYKLMKKISAYQKMLSPNDSYALLYVLYSYDQLESNEKTFKPNFLLINNILQKNPRSKSGNDTLLHLASKLNYPKLVEKTLETTDINSKNNRGNTPLIEAIKNNTPEVAKLLINKGADINIVNKTGNTALIWATTNNLEDIVKQLFTKKVSVKNINSFNQSDNTALILAIKNKYLPIAKLLIENGANINMKMHNGRTILLLTIEANKPDLAKFLINNGADVNIEDHYGYTPLISAIANEQPDIAKQLIEKGAKVNVFDNRYFRTPLKAAIETNQPNIVKLLIENQVYVNGGEEEDWQSQYQRPLDLAIKKKYPEIITILKEAGAKTSKELEAESMKMN